MCHVNTFSTVTDEVVAQQCYQFSNAFRILITWYVTYLTFFTMLSQQHQMEWTSVLAYNSYYVAIGKLENIPAAQQLLDT